jgi:hypothetical protein
MKAFGDDERTAVQSPQYVTAIMMRPGSGSNRLGPKGYAPSIAFLICAHQVLTRETRSVGTGAGP